MTRAIFPYELSGIPVGCPFCVVSLLFPSLLSLSLSPCRASLNCFQITPFPPLTIIYRITYAHSHSPLSLGLVVVHAQPLGVAHSWVSLIPPRLVSHPLHTPSSSNPCRDKPFPARFSAVCSVEWLLLS